MPIQQTKKQSDLEKRLQLLRKQVYGQQSAAHTTNYQLRPQSEASQLPTTDISYLRQDLTKILFLSAIAIGIQIILFFLLQNHILNLDFLYNRAL